LGGLEYQRLWYVHTPQTPGMSRAAGITHAGAQKRWAGSVTIQREDGRASPRRAGERPLCPQGQGAQVPGREAEIPGGGLPYQHL